MDSLAAGRIILDGIVLHPVAAVVPLLTWIDTPVIMSGQEGLVALTLAFEGLQFGGHINGSIAIIADIQRNHPYRIAGNQELIALLIVEHKGEDA